MELVFTVAGAGLVSNPFAAPYPTLSTIEVPVGFAPEIGVVLFTNATLPVVPDILVIPVASGVGRFAVPPAPAASCIK